MCPWKGVPRPGWAGTLIAALVLTLAGCGGGAGPKGGSGPAADAEASSGSTGEPLLVYSGRNEALIGPLLGIFTQETGVETKVRYGSTTEMAATLLEEGNRTPADVFLSQDAAALGAIAGAGLFRELAPEILGRVPERFRAPGGEWIGLSGRARAIVFNTAKVRPDELPQSLEEVGSSRYRGRFGVAPTNGSFQAHMAVYRAVHGAGALKALLDAMVANEPGRYPKNSAIVEAVIAGEVDWGLVNHYYLWRARKENPTAPAENYFFPEGEGSGFVNTAGAGVLSERPEAERLVGFLVSERAQRYFAEETFEYPLAAGVEPSVELPALAGVASASVDFGEVSEVFEETLAAIAASGLVR